MEARRTAGLNSAPPCSWSLSPPSELKEAPAHALSANAGFVTFGLCLKTHIFSYLFICCCHHYYSVFISAVIFPRHVEGQKLDRTVWSLSTFHAYVSYHVKVGLPSTKLLQFHVSHFIFVYSVMTNAYVEIFISPV